MSLHTNSLSPKSPDGVSALRRAVVRVEPRSQSPYLHLEALLDSEISNPENRRICCRNVAVDHDNLRDHERAEEYFCKSMRMSRE